MVKFREVLEVLLINALCYSLGGIYVGMVAVLIDHNTITGASLIGFTTYLILVALMSPLMWLVHRR